MKSDDKYFYWKKGEVYPFNKYFKTSEFSCKCNNSSCVEQKASKELVECLTKLRELVNEPLIITSAFRCEKHQQHLRNSGVNTASRPIKIRAVLKNDIHVRVPEI